MLCYIENSRSYQNYSPRSVLPVSSELLLLHNARGRPMNPKSVCQPLNWMFWGRFRIGRRGNNNGNSNIMVMCVDYWKLGWFLATHLFSFGFSKLIRSFQQWNDFIFGLHWKCLSLMDSNRIYYVCLDQCAIGSANGCARFLIIKRFEFEFK